MKKVTLLGDSIRLGYGPRVAELLGPEVTVYQPEDNCRFAKYTLRMLFDERERIEGSDVIHFNCGMWDICNLFGDGTFTDKQEYVSCMLRVAEQLKKLGKHLIFATTTPVLEGNPYNRNEDIEAFNAAIVPLFVAEGIRIDDLYTPVFPERARLIRADDKLHLNEAGIEFCAERVAAAISAVFSEEKD